VDDLVQRAMRDGEDAATVAKLEASRDKAEVAREDAKKALEGALLMLEDVVKGREWARALDANRATYEYV
jgi:hypothetical protein